MGGVEADDELLRRLEDTTRDASRLQLHTLSAILRRNVTCAYLRPHLGHLADDADAEAFRRLVPISSYEDYADHIQRMADGAGDDSALSFDPLICFFYRFSLPFSISLSIWFLRLAMEELDCVGSRFGLISSRSIWGSKNFHSSVLISTLILWSSSGTSSTRPKMVPFFDSPPARASSGLAHQASSALLRRLVPPRPTINKILWFLYAGNITETRAKFKVMAASAYPFQSSSGPNPSPVLSLCVTPRQVIVATDVQQQMYCHLLCGLRNRHLIDGIRAPYAAGLVRAIRLLESKWEQLCEDIESGTVSSEVTDPAMRDAAQGLLGGPQPEVAGAIREICGRGRWGGTLSELWAEARYIACVTTGSMEQYYHVLKYYAGASLPVLCGDYMASECPIGINLDRRLPPAETSFVLLPTAAYFEFLPFDVDLTPAAKDLVDISGLEVGKLYEVVVTTYRGFYRYRLGDVVKVVGFHNTSPRLEFVTRAPKDYSEAFTEKDLMSAIQGLQVMLRENEVMGNIVEYAGFLDLESTPKHAVIFVEMEKGWWSLEKNEMGDVDFFKRACPFLETSLGSVYKVKRTRGDLGPIEIAIVKPGSFDDLARVAVENGAPANQYKPPKFLRNSNFVNFLKASVISNMRLPLDEERPTLFV